MNFLLFLYVSPSFVILLILDNPFYQNSINYTTDGNGIIKRRFRYFYQTILSILQGELREKFSDNTELS